MINMISGSPAAAVLMLCAILLPVAAACGVWCAGRLAEDEGSRAALSVRDGILYACVAAVFLCVLGLGANLGAAFAMPGVCGLGVSFGVDGLRLILCTLASFLWLMTTLFSREYLAHSGHKTRYYFYLLLTEGAILGVFLSADLYTTLICFEVMSMTSWVLVAHEETPGAMRAADSYLAFAVIGGLATLMGLFLLYHLLGTLEFAELAAAAAACTDKAALYVAGAFTLVGFAAKAGMYPLHTWLPAAHPVAPAPASALLSGIITKAGMYGILVLAAQLFFRDAAWGMVMLCFGLVTMFTGAMLAVFSIDLKRTLACSSMSQIGFILVGVGMQALLAEESGMAVWGLVLHICNHSIFKLCLFLCAGVVVMNLHRLDLNDVRGFGRGKPLLMYTFGMASLGIMGIPLWSGYVSKTLLHESIVEYAELLAEEGLNAGFFHAAEWVFLISGGLTVAYMTKLFVCLFVEKNADPAVQSKFDSKNRRNGGRYMNALSAAVLAIAGTLPPVLGLSAHGTMEKAAALANPFFASEGPAHTVRYLSLANLKGGVISIAIGLAVYFVLIRPLLMKKGVYLDRWPKALSIEDGIYRPLLLGVLPFVGGFAARLAASVFEWLRRAACAVLYHNDNNGYVYPQEDTRFTRYEQQPEGVQGFAGSLAFSLMLFGFGMVGILVYLIVR